MDVDNERVLKLIFPNGVPENLLNSPESLSYLEKLGTYKVDQLKKEQTYLLDESKHVVEQIQDLAISNYKLFIQTAENSRSIYKEFGQAESQVSAVLEKLPNFKGKFEQFQSQSAEINEKRRINTITLQKNGQLLEILEIPQLMERCIREGRYEEALELASCVQKMAQNQGTIQIIQSIVAAVDNLWQTMLVQLVAQLRTDLQLPICLQIVGFLRRMQAFTNSELRLKFLQARNTWFMSTLKDIPKNDAQQHLMKTIEVTRINLFNIITQYRAIFPDNSNDEPSTETAGFVCDGQRLFYAWLQRKIAEFLKTLQLDLERGVTSMEAVLDQCMYFGLSFSRVGADFRALMVPLFVRTIRRNFLASIESINEQFALELDKFTLINKVPIHTRSKVAVEGEADLNCLSPPDTLLDYLPLAILCNGYLSTFNELRLCAPIALAPDVTKSLQDSLSFVASKIYSFYKQEQQAFSGKEQEVFDNLCACFTDDLLPFVQRCIQALFPQQQLATVLGRNLIELEESELTCLNVSHILKPLQQLLPQKVETFVASADEIKVVAT